MDNRHIAAVFLEMGELLQIQGGERYRARAFKRTAQILEGLREPVTELMKFGRLQAIPGIGEGSYRRIMQILRTGTCADHQKLLSRLPAGLREVLHIRGMGPRHTRLVFETLGVRNLEDLERAAKSGALARLPGVAQRTVDRVLKHLEEKKRGPDPRVLLRDALAIGVRVRAWLLDDGSAVAVEQVGSARRRKETVGDLDFVASTQRPDAAIERFSTLPGVTDVVIRGESRAQVILEGGIQADLWTVPPDRFVSTVSAFTGSQQHNIQLRLRANRMKLHLSDHGVWERKLFGRGQGDDNRKISRKVVEGNTETEIFAALGLQEIPPEIREGTGEIEAAAKRKLPTLVDVGDLKGDLHLRPRDMREASALLHAAKVRGLEYVAFVCPEEMLVDKSAAQDFIREIHLMEERIGVRALTGVLVPILADGSLGGDAGAREVVDLVYGVVSGDLDQPQDEMTKRIVRAIEGGGIDVLHRPTRRVLLEDPGIEIEIWAILKSAARARVLIEVSGVPSWLDLDARGIRTNLEVGAQMSITSGATRSEELGDVQYAVWQARRGWCARELVGNTMSLAELTAWREDRRPETAKPARKKPKRVVHEYVDDDPIVKAISADPLAPETLERLENFLRSSDDPALERALEKTAGNALQRAFELVAKARR